jgi:pimeloyl-ACP methyl ester carboxylesterase
MNGQKLVAWNLRHLRVGQWLSQEKLAADAGVDRTYMSRLERELENHGSHDIMIPTINSFTLSQHIPNAQLIIYPDSGHASHFQYPDLFLSHARMFLDG